MQQLRRYLPHLEPIYADLFPGDASYIDPVEATPISERAKGIRARYDLDGDRPVPVGPPTPIDRLELRLAVVPATPRPA